MVKDYEIMQNPDLLLQKKIIIWGAGKTGRELAGKMKSLTENIEFVDSDCTKRACLEKDTGKVPIYAPEKIGEYTREGLNIAIVIPTDNVKLSENIVHQITEMNYLDVDIYTKYAMEAILCFRSRQADEEQFDKCSILQRKLEEDSERIRVLENSVKILKKIAITQMTGKAVYIYQNKKVASQSIAESIKAIGMNGFHVHKFRIHGFDDCFIREMIKKTSGKVISIVREPVARQISLLWHYWDFGGEEFLKKYNSFEDLQSKFFSIPNDEDEFEWYEKEFLSILNIRICDYPFDRDLGYTIIEKDGISLLLLKMEKLDTLEEVIGDFLGVDNFKLTKINVGEEKGCRYAYKNYLENVKIPSAFFDYYYSANKYMDHFYTEEEKKKFCKRWDNHIIKVES